jgi:hypothetical protein
LLAVNLTNPVDQELKAFLFSRIAYAVDVLEKECSRPQVFYNPKIFIEGIRSWVFQAECIPSRPIGRFGERLTRRTSNDNIH